MGMMRIFVVTGTIIVCFGVTFVTLNMFSDVMGFVFISLGIASLLLAIAKGVEDIKEAIEKGKK